MDWKDTPPAEPRKIFKISEYNNPLYGIVYVIYCSILNPRPNQLMMYNCFFANKREGGLKIFKSYRFTSDLDISEEIL